MGNNIEAGQKIEGAMVGDGWSKEELATRVAGAHLLRTKEPITLGGWYEHTDGSVGRYSWRNGIVSLSQVAAHWGEVEMIKELDLEG